jgi:hypothetical protein
MKTFFIFISKLFLRAAIDKTLETQLPKIYEKLDAKLPIALLNGASSSLIKSEIEFTIGQVTRKPVNKEILDIVTTLYDPIQNAGRTQHRPR